MGQPGLRGRDRAGRAVRVAVAAAAVVAPLTLTPAAWAGAVAPALVRSATPVDDQAADAKYYVVQDAWEGQPEFLYSIAERLLGTGDRALEIYQLNEGRAQPGGMVVSDPNVIRPGWVLLLPPDAAGDGVQVGPLPTPPPVAVRATATPTPAGGTAGAARPTGRASAPAASDDEAGRSDDAAGSSDASGGSVDLAQGATVVIGALAGTAALVLLVGGAVVVVRRRRAGGTPPPATPVRREDPGAWTIDRTTRALAQACATAGREVPGVVAIVLSDDEVRLRLSTPDARPPAGWTADPAGRTWTSPMRPLQDVALDAHVVAPFPRLVTLGDAAQGRVLVDLAQAGPGVAVDGDPAQALALVERWRHELATSPWSRQVPVVAVGVGPDAHDRLEDAGPAVDAAGGGVLVVGGARPRDGGLLAVLAEDPAWTVVVVGPAGRDWARWRLTLDAEGVAAGGPLDADVHVQTGRPRLELV